MDSKKDQIDYVHDVGVKSRPSASIGDRPRGENVVVWTCSLGAIYSILFLDPECK